MSPAKRGGGVQRHATTMGWSSSRNGAETAFCYERGCQPRNCPSGQRMQGTRNQRKVRGWLAAALMIVAAAMPIPAKSAPALDVTVAMRGGTVVVDVRMEVHVDVAHAWAVLTDYPHMAQFVSDLRFSEVLEDNDNVLLVRQIGETRFGLLRFAYDTVRKVVLTPMVGIRSDLVSGDFKSYRFSTRLLPTADGCIVVNHGEYVPDRWVPPVIGPALIAQATRKQYEQLGAEMLRRMHRVGHVRPG